LKKIKNNLPVFALLVPVGALPEPAVLPLLDRLQEVLADDVGAVVGLGGRGVSRVGAVLLLDDRLELLCFFRFRFRFFFRGESFGCFSVCVRVCERGFEGTGSSGSERRGAATKEEGARRGGETQKD
jgi:hypothetical protein